MKITLLQPVQHDGKAHAVGDTLNLDEAQATALIDCGAAEKAGGKAAAEAKAKADADPSATT